jgi:glycosyltransferase involved in cell wall biosynthesis
MIKTLNTMKVLMASWSWEPVGGDWTYIQNVKRLYEAHGYEVIPFSTYLADKTDQPPHKYFVKAYDYKKLNNQKGLFTGLKAAKNSVISFEAMSNIDQILDEHDISFAHLHNVHHWLTPAIIWKLKKRGVPVLWSLHDYKIICPEGTLFSNGSICEKCKGGKFYQCTINKCKKGSMLASLLATIDAYFYNGGGIYNKVDAYLCPSEFLLKKFGEFGFDQSRMHLSNLCYDTTIIDRYLEAHRDPEGMPPKEDYILYVGRIERNKGIHTLIDAIEGTGIPLKIAGTGSALEELKARVAQKGLNHVEFLGFQNKDAVFDLTRRSRFIVCPSEWYENYPYAIIETLLFSKPVIGSRIGGIPELVLDGKTGLLHEMGNAADLREKLLTLWNNPPLARKMGIQAREHAYARVNFETHWNFLENIIENLSFKNGRNPIENPQATLI